MNSYPVRRLLQFIPVLFGITLFTFFLMRMIPGDPCQMSHSQFVPIEIVERCRMERGLDKPIMGQFLFYLGSLFSGSSVTNQSIVYNRSAMSLLLERLPATIFLVGYGGTLTVLLALFIGLGSAIRPGSLFDRAMNGATATALTMPAFLIGMLLIIIFSLKLHLFPTSGYGRNFWDHLRYLFLPALTLAISNGAMLARVLRRSLINVMASPFILTAHAKGVPNRRVFSHHVFRNGLISPLTLLGLQIAWLFGGSVVVETVFALPGIGSLMVQSILDRDYAVVQIITIFFALIVSCTSLVTDMIYPLVDPRVRYG
jgi:ABC-type dipeptide/oligopeptide/nickel transport system permease component